MRTAFPFLALLLAACGPSAVTLATEGFLVTATSGPEQLVALTTFGDTFGPGETSSLPLLRTCDTAADYAALVTAADADGDGELSESEAEDAMAAQRGGEGHGHGRHGGHWLDLLRLVYDVDQDGAFSDEEMTPLFEDFTARCEVLQTNVVTRFDADGDGAISDTELATAQATLAAEAEALRGTADDVDGDMNGPDGDHDGRGGDHDGERGDHDGDGHGHDVFDFTIVPAPFSAWDTDASGTWSGTELETFRTEIRARIASGAAILPPPPVVDTGSDTGATDTGTTDTGATDTGSDTGAADTGSDTGATDTGATDTGAADTGA